MSARVFVSCLIAFSFGIACANPATQSKVTTAFIYQFTNYISWPEASRTPASLEKFVISVVGDSPIISELKELAKIKMIKGRAIEVNGVAGVSELKRSDVIFVASSEVGVLQEVAKKAKGTGALIISQSEGFAKKGAMINFFVENGRLRFEINRAALEEEKLQASSQLLNLARVVE